MNHDLKAAVIERCRRMEIPLVGVAGTDRWENPPFLPWMPEEFYPQAIFPEARSVIVIGLPVHLPVLETAPSIYYHELYKTVNTLLDQYAYRLASFLNDQGYFCTAFRAASPICSCASGVPGRWLPLMVSVYPVPAPMRRFIYFGDRGSERCPGLPPSRNASASSPRKPVGCGSHDRSGSGSSSSWWSPASSAFSLGCPCRRSSPLSPKFATLASGGASCPKNVQDSQNRI
jgi:hypothetical protein